MNPWIEEYEQRLSRRTCHSPMIVGGLIIVGFILIVMHYTAGGTAPTYTTDPDGTPCRTAPVAEAQ